MASAALLNRVDRRCTGVRDVLRPGGSIPVPKVMPSHIPGTQRFSVNGCYSLHAEAGRIPSRSVGCSLREACPGEIPSSSFVRRAGQR